MKKGPIVLTVLLALVATPILTPTAASLERFRRGPIGSGPIRRGPIGGGPIVTRPFAPHPIAAHSFDSQRFSRRPSFDRFTRFGRFAAPIVVYAPPSVFYAQPTYADAPAVYGPPAGYGPPAAYGPPAVYGPPAGYDPPAPATVSIAPPPSPMPGVIEYPTGRYELRGDGMTEAYRWVWIPNPPPGPPEPPAGAPVSPGPSAPGGQAPTRHSQLYHWTDPQGVEHWTDRWETIPDPYRDQVKQPRPS